MLNSKSTPNQQVDVCPSASLPSSLLISFLKFLKFFYLLLKYNWHTMLYLGTLIWQLYILPTAYHGKYVTIHCYNITDYIPHVYFSSLWLIYCITGSFISSSPSPILSIPQPTYLLAATSLFSVFLIQLAWVFVYVSLVLFF